MKPLAGLLLAACALAAQAGTHVVKIAGMQFAPAQLVVKPGDTVVWQNADLVPHTATAAGRFDSKTIAPGKRWSHVMAKAGHYDYVCALHPTMKASIEVK